MFDSTVALPSRLTAAELKLPVPETLRLSPPTTPDAATPLTAPTAMLTPLIAVLPS